MELGPDYRDLKDLLEPESEAEFSQVLGPHLDHDFKQKAIYIIIRKAASGSAPAWDSGAHALLSTCGHITSEGRSLSEWTFQFWDSPSQENLASLAAQGILYYISLSVPQEHF